MDGPISASEVAGSASHQAASVQHPSRSLSHAERVDPVSEGSSSRSTGRDEVRESSRREERPEYETRHPEVPRREKQQPPAYVVEVRHKEAEPRSSEGARPEQTEARQPVETPSSAEAAEETRQRAPRQQTSPREPPRAPERQPIEAPPPEPREAVERHDAEAPRAEPHRTPERQPIETPPPEPREAVERHDAEAPRAEPHRTPERQPIEAPPSEPREAVERHDADAPRPEPHRTPERQPTETPPPEPRRERERVSSKAPEPEPAPVPRRASVKTPRAEPNKAEEQPTEGERGGRPSDADLSARAEASRREVPEDRAYEPEELGPRPPRTPNAGEREGSPDEEPRVREQASSRDTDEPAPRSERSEGGSEKTRPPIPYEERRQRAEPENTGTVPGVHADVQPFRDNETPDVSPEVAGSQTSEPAGEGRAEAGGRPPRADEAFRQEAPPAEDSRGSEPRRDLSEAIGRAKERWAEVNREIARARDSAGQDAERTEEEEEDAVEEESNIQSFPDPSRYASPAPNGNVIYTPRFSPPQRSSLTTKALDPSAPLGPPAVAVSTAGEHQAAIRYQTFAMALSNPQQERPIIDVFV